jgi:hypothetical protein
VIFKLFYFHKYQTSLLGSLLLYKRSTVTHTINISHIPARNKKAILTFCSTLWYPTIYSVYTKLTVVIPNPTEKSFCPILTFYANGYTNPQLVIAFPKSPFFSTLLNCIFTPCRVIRAIKNITLIEQRENNEYETYLLKS